MSIAIQQPPTNVSTLNLSNIDSNYVATSSGNFFPPYFVPRDNDVMIGRGKKCSQHLGNERLRRLVTCQLDQYSAATTKNDKSNIILGIVCQVKMGSSGGSPNNKYNNGTFIKYDRTVGLWFDVGDFLAREKVSQTFRDALHHNYRSSNEFKKKRRREERNADDIMAALPGRRKMSTKHSRTEDQSACHQFSPDADLVLLNDWENNELPQLDVFEDSSMVKATDLPPSAALTEWFEESNFLEPTIPIALFDSLMTSLDKDIEQCSEILNDCISLQTAEGDRCERLDYNGHSHSCINRPTFKELPSRNCCVAKTA